VVFDDSRWQMTARGNIYVLDSSGQPQNPPDPAQVTVMLYGPHPDTGGLLETPLAASTNTTTGVVTYSLTTSIGPRFLRAYLGSPPTRKSRIVRFGGGNVINLEILP
jgi:hypothetical protein